jgi:hypothetical protein
MGETRVDLLHLLEDLADAYPGDLEETVLTEIVANALDSGATTIALVPDPSASTLTVIDDGTGMRRAELRRFHDMAASSKERGKGIGFAGVGIKLGLLLSEEVLTETRRGKEHVATTWAMVRRRRAPWRWVPAPGLVAVRGTAVRLRLMNPLSPLLDRGYLESTLRKHFEPLFDPHFDQALRTEYPQGVRLTIAGASPERSRELSADEATIELRLPRKRSPSAFGCLRRYEHPLPEDRRGVAVSTYGKVIKRGWDWLGLTPAAADRVSGLVEIPGLAAALTLNKGDFVRSGPRGALYLSYRKALQEVIVTQLAEWGDPAQGDDRTRRRAARPMERDLEAILVDLSDRFPLLATLVEKRAGGKRNFPVGNGESAGGEPIPDFFAPAPGDISAGEPEADSAEAAPQPETAGSMPSEVTTPRVALPAPDQGGRSRVKQPMRLGLRIQFESRPDEAELAKLVESTVWVNDAHPAHRRAVASRSEGYHLALCVAIALADVAVPPQEERGFITEFLVRWGESVDQNGRGRRRGRLRGARRDRPKRGA